MLEVKESNDNAQLALACSKVQAACCRDGYVFLPRSEYQAIIEHLANKPNDLLEFTSRVVDHSDFLLYNQQTRCQFLHPDERCELHPLGIKPSECFWWPAHVYLADDGTMEIRVAACCSGCSFIQPESSHIKKVAEQARAIGLQLLKNFRTVHSYGKGYKV